ncbi:unnamed protein product [Rotaria sp. Silwood1]|nr:unnamed protein product [Rotaria sp. Silwood1]
MALGLQGKLAENKRTNIDKIQSFLISNRDQLFEYEVLKQNCLNIKIESSILKNLLNVKDNNLQLHFKKFRIMIINIEKNSDRFKKDDLKSLLIVLDKIDLNHINENKKDIEVHLANLKLFLVNLYLKMLNSENETILKEKQMSSNQIDEIIYFIQFFWNKLFRIFNVKNSYSNLLEYFDEIHHLIKINEFEINTITKTMEIKTDEIQLKIFEAKDSSYIFLEFEETLKTNLSNILCLLDGLSSHYLADKKEQYRKLLEKIQNLNIDQIYNQQYLKHLLKYCRLYCSLTADENEALIRLENIQRVACFNIAINVLNEIILTDKNEYSICLMQQEAKPLESRIKQGKEIDIIKINRNEFTIFYKNQIDDTISNFITDDKELVNELSTINFNYDILLDRETFKKVYNLIDKMIKSQNSYVQKSFEKNRILEYIKSKSKEIDLDKSVLIHLNEISRKQLQDTVSYTYESKSLIGFLNTDKENKYIEDILAMIANDKEKERYMKELDEIFQMPIIGWEEELATLRIELLENKILNRFEQKNSDKAKIHDCIKQSHFFAENRLDEWFDLIRTIATINRDIRCISLDDITKLILRLVDFDDLSIVKTIIVEKRPEQWLFEFLFARIESNIYTMLSNNDDELKIKFCRLKRTLRLCNKVTVRFLEIFGYLVLEYKKELSGSFNRDSRMFLIELIDLVIDSEVYLDEILLDKLHLKSLPLWISPLEKRKLVRELEQIPLFSESLRGKFHTVNYLCKIREEYGKDLLKQLLNLFQNIEFTNENTINTIRRLNDLLEKLAYGGYTLDKDSLTQLNDKPFDQWENVLK